MKRTIEIVMSLMRDLDSLSLTGTRDWETGINMAKKLIAVKHDLEEEEKQNKKAYDEAIEEAKKKREQMKKEAAERGEEIVGGETVRVYEDGTQEVIIP